MLKGLFRRLRGLPNADTPSEGDGAPDRIALARALLQAERREEVITCLDHFLTEYPDVAEARFLRGTALLELGRVQEAVPDLTHAVSLRKAEPRYLYNLAVAHWTLGDPARAALLCEEAVQQADFAPAHVLLSQFGLRGENYFEVLERIHTHLKPATYLEIGVSKGESLRLAGSQTVAIAVDPEPQLVEPLRAGHRVYAQTSDDFFSTHDVLQEFGGAHLDLAFIDGMHQFEYALRDFINIERLAHASTVVMVHDCYPLDEATAQRVRQTAFWSGDTWKIVPLLKKYRPDLDLHTVATPPTGLCIIGRLDPASTILSDRYDDLVEEFLAFGFSQLAECKPEMLNLFPNQWQDIRTLLDSHTRALTSGNLPV